MSTWVLHTPPAAHAMIADPIEVRRALALFADPDAGCEVMALTSGVRRTLPGADLGGLARAVGQLPSGAGIYFRVNPVPATLDRPANNPDILRRRWVYIDVDPVKPDAEKDHPATQEEKDRTATVCDAVVGHLHELGWPAPVITDSGNGFALLYRCDLPNDEPTRAVYRRLLADLGARFSCELGVIDKAVHNANRLVKLPGTWARKGKHTEERPHRPCRLETVPDVLGLVTAELLRAAAGPEAPPPSPSVNGTRNGRPADRRAVVDRAGQYLARCAESVSGQHGHDALLWAASVLVHGFELSDDEALALLLAEFNPRCAPPWPDKDVSRKVSEARTHPLDKPKGWLLNSSNPYGDWSPPWHSPRPYFGTATPSVNGAPTGSAVGVEWSVLVDGQVVEEGSPLEFAPPIATPTGGPQHRYELFTLGGLLDTQFPEPVWVVPGLLSEGLNILAGKPKMGKSMIALNLGITIAAGGQALGNIATTPGDVLYISLEDRTRRLQARARKMLRGLGVAVSHRLTVAAMWPRQGEGGLELVEWWMKRVARPALVIIDVWTKFRPQSNQRANQYSQDYEHLIPLKDLMDRRGCCALALLHCRKGASEDVIEDVSGTLGLAGAADGIIVLQRARNDNEAKIFVTGRDVPDTELALRFDPEHLTWTNLGSAEEHVGGKLQQAIIKYLRSLAGEAAFAPDIAAAVNEEADKIRPVLHRLFDRKLIRRVGRAWSFPGEDETPGNEP